MIIIRILLIIVRRRRRRAVAPTSNTASHDYHEKISWWVSIGMGLRLAALWAAGAPLKVIICLNTMKKIEIGNVIQSPRNRLVFMAIAWNMNLEITFEPIVNFYWIYEMMKMHICQGYVRYAGSWIFPRESLSQVLQQTQSPDQGSFFDADFISWVLQRHKMSLCPCKHIQSSWLEIMKFLRRNVIKIANILATKSRDYNPR